MTFLTTGLKLFFIPLSAYYLPQGGISWEVYLISECFSLSVYNWHLIYLVILIPILIDDICMEVLTEDMEED